MGRGSGGLFTFPLGSLYQGTCTPTRDTVENLAKYLLINFQKADKTYLAMWKTKFL